MTARDDEGPGRSSDRTRRAVAGGLVALPVVVLLVATAVGAADARGRFEGALAGLVVIVSVGAFATGASGARAAARALAVVSGAAALAGLVYGLAGLGRGAAGGGPGLFVLYLGAGAGAVGLSALGRAIRTPPVAAGAVGACILWTAMAGLFWADPVAEHVPRTRRRPFRQAVLHVDASLALAYGVVGYDRMRTEEVYFDVPLASSFYERPGAATTGAAWLATGLAAWGAAWAVGARRARRKGRPHASPRATSAGPDAGPSPSMVP